MTDRPASAPVPGRRFNLTSARPSLRVGVVAAAAGVIVVMALVLSTAAANRLRETATEAARHNVESIVRGYIDPSLHAATFDLDAVRDPEVNAQLERLSLAGAIRLINLWSPHGTIVYSSDASLREQRFPINPQMAAAFGGATVSEYESANEHDGDLGSVALPDRFLEIYVPIRGVTDGSPFGVYEVYQDARPIEDQVEATRRDVFVVAVAGALFLLALLWLAFSGASGRLSKQNRMLRERGHAERLLAIDLRRSEERFRSLVRNSADIIQILRADGTIAYESPAVEGVLGYTVPNRMNRPAMDIAHPEDLGHAEYLFREVLRGPGIEATAEFRVHHADGSVRTLQALAKNLIDDPAVAEIVVNYRDVTERRALEEQLRHQAFHDSLTGLANRALFSDRLDHALARRSSERRPLAILFIDLDDFKGVNDTVGHGVGDQLLVAAAGRVRASLRPVDTAARMGGDEFAVLIEDLDDVDAARSVAERVLAALRAPFNLQETATTVHGSIGMVFSPQADESAEELLRNADIAMYLAKSQGKDRTVLYEPADGDVAVGRLQLKADLQRAFDRDEFDLAYQPIVQLDTGAVRGFEALLRWEHPTRGQVGPTEFIPLTEESGLIVPLGRWVLQRACLDASTWPDVGDRPLVVNVNLSGRQLEDPSLVADVTAALDNAGLSPARLTLEITESVLMRDVALATATLHALKRIGIGLAIDDFGTGYSSLGYLRQFPIDALKIDRSFVASLADGRTDSALVGSIVRLARTLRLETVAEGIEQAGQLEVLRSLGTRFGQGFYFARPLPRHVVAAFLRRAARSTNGAVPAPVAGVIALAGRNPSAVPHHPPLN